MFHLEPIFLEPLFKERLWGGKRLHTLFDYNIPTDQIGEAWVISAHNNGPSKIISGPLKGKYLPEVWSEHPYLFGKLANDKDFPLLVKIIDANDNLSIQVHPDDNYATKVENAKYGKSECWYVLDCEQDSEIILGHQSSSKEEFQQLVDTGKWDELLSKVKVKKGDFYYVPSGTIHSIGKGIIILEIQQSSDITYRVYDYDRKDDEGNMRVLHIQSAVEVMNFPHVPYILEKVKEIIGDLTSSLLIKEKYFTIYHWKLNGKVSTPLKSDYLLVSVINGMGKITVNKRSFPISKRDNFILPSMIGEYVLEGNMEIVVSHE